MLISGWLSYHLLSYVIGAARTADGVAVAPSRTPDANIDDVVARIQASRRPGQSPVELPLLSSQGPSREPLAPAAATAKAIPLAEEAKAVTAKAQGLIASGMLVEARNVVSRLLNQHPQALGQPAVRDMALKLGEKTILSDEVFASDPLCYYYAVASGDYLAKIAQSCKVPHAFIARINAVSDPRRLRAGQRIKLVRGPINAVVFKGEYAIYLYLQDALFARYPVGLGKDDKTPEGTWVVDQRVKDPPFYDAEASKVYAPNDPENPTGGYWLRLKGLTGEAVGKEGFGIHGTTEPESIGKSQSKGCIRMRNEDVAQVFDMMVPGESKVTILP